MVIFHRFLYVCQRVSWEIFAWCKPWRDASLKIWRWIVPPVKMNETARFYDRLWSLRVNPNQEKHDFLGVWFLGDGINSKFAHGDVRGVTRNPEFGEISMGIKDEGCFVRYNCWILFRRTWKEWILESTRWILVGYLFSWIFFFGMTRNDLTFCRTWKMSVAIDSLSAALLWTANETGRAVPKVASLVMNRRHLCKLYGAFNVSFVAKMCRLGASSKKLPGEFCQRFPTSSTWNASHVRDHGDSSLKQKRLFREALRRIWGGDRFWKSSRWLCLKMGH